MKFRRSELIHFYDDPGSLLFSKAGRGGNVSAITAVIGEDLLIGILIHYWRSANRYDPVHLQGPCKGPGKKGKRLDAWIVRDPTTIFQVEIKNWSSHSIGGKRLAEDASPADVCEEASRRWGLYFGTDKLLPDGAAKVLLEMDRPAPYSKYELERLLCFWFAISGPQGLPMSIVELSGKRLHVFSASLYLRSLQDTFIDVHVPRVEERLRQLDTLIVRQEVAEYNE